MGINIKGQVGWATFPNTVGRSRLPYPTLALLINLLTHSDGFDASYALIKDQTGMSKATVSTALKNLQKLELISVSKKPGKNGQFDSNSYDFHPDRLWNLTPEYVEDRLPKKSTGSGNELGTGSGNEPAPVQEMNRKKEQGERSMENDQPPTGVDADASGSVINPDSDLEKKSGDKIRRKDMQEFGDAYSNVTPLTGQMWGELARVWSQMHKSGELPAQDVLLDSLRGYYRAVKHNAKITGRDAVKRPANWLRDCMWLATENELKFSPNGGHGHQDNIAPAGYRKLNAAEIRTLDIEVLKDNPHPDAAEMLATGYARSGTRIDAQGVSQSAIQGNQNMIIEMEMN